MAVAAPNGDPIWTKSGRRSYPKKVVRRTNDGDVRYYDYNDPECPKDTRIDNALWFVPENWNNTIQSYREISGNPDGLWPEIKQPWWTYSGYQTRIDRFKRIAKETNKSKYNKPWWSQYFWRDLKYKLAENIDNNYLELQREERLKKAKA